MASTVSWCWASRCSTVIPAWRHIALDPLDRRRVRARRRRQHAEAALEQLGKAGLGARVLGAGDRVAGDEMDTLGQQRADVADHRGLDRADVGDDAAGLEPRRHRFADPRIGPERRAQHDDVGALDDLARVRGGAVGDAEGAGGVEAGVGAGADGDVPGGLVAAQRVGERRADQADADDGDALGGRRRVRRSRVQSLTPSGPHSMNASTARHRRAHLVFRGRW